jgi:hypothetical protein
MKKVKIFKHHIYQVDELEKEINDFLKNLNEITIIKILQNEVCNSIVITIFYEDNNE